MVDKYTAVWVSHSSMGDFLKCPRSYYLHNMYKDPRTGHKVSIVTPHMSLGIAVHEVLEGLAEFPANERMNRDLLSLYETGWKKVSGKKGGFQSIDEEAEFKARGTVMLEKVTSDPRFLVNKCIKLPQDKMPCNFYLSEEHNIILNGLVDWIEYLPETDSLHIIDFKTGKVEEKDGSLQLPIYLLLCNALQKRKVTKASYWYLESDKMVEKELPHLDKALRDVLEVAMKVKCARDTAKREGVDKAFVCPQGAYDVVTKDGGCMNCRPYEFILNDDPSVEFVGVGGFSQDMYVMKR
ncbi:MAG: PD-(D/E)XK nuclease family protein [Candidatus Yonathbacteria bacterium]|nr:PD-(D/E)XK nuclease family protein [Candidatus Yonathbacteria bacterium]